MVRALVLKLVPRAALPVVESVVPLRRLPSDQQACDRVWYSCACHASSFSPLQVFGLAPWAGVVGLGALWMVQARRERWLLAASRQGLP